MIDSHNHNIPNADDDSESLDVSFRMLKNKAERGIADVGYIKS